MKNVKKAIVAVCVSGGILGGALIAHADSKNDGESLAISTAAININKAIDIALDAIPGFATEAQFELKNDRSIWEVEVVNADKQVYELDIDANSGEVLKQELDDDSY